MAARIEEVMTRNPTSLTADATLVAAARTMKDLDIGNVVVVEDGRPIGIVTDRDIVVRGLGAGRAPDATSLREISSMDLTTLGPRDDVDAAAKLMRDKAVRRLPVVDGDTVVGIVSLGDLAQRRDLGSALAEISAARPNR